jgi:NADH-quinone oxidoreductase subunit E
MKQEFDKIPEIIGKHRQDPESMIMILQDIQKEYRYLPKEALKQTARALDIPLSKVYSASTFYGTFSLVPRGRNEVRVCVGTACHIRGSSLILEQLENMLDVKAGQTTKDQEYTLESVACVGACAMAPLVVVNDKYHGSVKVSGCKKLLRKK